ncbi:hypothetical protein J6590_078328 [Homalodisca vitripennis]|nr:hypothetical protein J6590_078328 [Homalodisca vitripennis]
MRQLERCGLRSLSHSRLSSYLKDRDQFVEILNVTSNKIKVIHGVPQGSILGPRLFLVYVGGLNLLIQSSLQQKKERERLRRLRRLTTDDTSASGVGRPLGPADRQTDETTRYQPTNDKQPLHRTTGSQYIISCMVLHWNVLTIIKDSEESYSKKTKPKHTLPISIANVTKN